MGIAAAVEGAYGTDQVPTAALNAMLVENAKIVPLEGDEIVEEHIRPGSLGGFLKRLINKRIQLDFDIRLRGAGSAGGVPAIDPILRACGFAATNNATVSEVYNLVSQGFESATVYLFRGNSTNGIRHRMLGVRGSWKLSVDNKKHPVMSFSLQGLYVDPTSLAMPTTFDFSGFTAVPIVPVNNTNTTFTLGGVAHVMEKLDIDAGLTVQHRPLVNYEAVDITGRNTTGSMVIEEPLIGTTDLFSTAYGTPEVMVLENGLTAGQIVRIDAARVQRGKPSLGDSSGVSMLTIPLGFVPSDAGDDNDLSITFK